MKRDALFAILIFVPVSLAAQTQTGVLKIRYSMTSSYDKAGTTASSFTTAVTRYVAPDGTVRTETTDRKTGQIEVEISNETQDYHIVIDNKNRTATRINGLYRGVHTGTVGTRGTKADLGPATIQGYSCEGYANTFASGVVMKQWVCKDPTSGSTFPGRIEAMHGSSQTVTAIVGLDRNQSVPASLFEVPPGYTVADADATSGIRAMTLEPAR